MARTSGGGFRGGARGGSKSSFGAASNGGRRSTGRSSSGRSVKGTTQSNDGSAKKGARSSASGKNVVAYSLYDSRGKRTYIGSTNNPARRATEHSKSGKLKSGGSLVVESPRMNRSDAQRLEAKKLDGYKRRTGRLPKGNTAPNGQFRLF